MADTPEQLAAKRGAQKNRRQRERYENDPDYRARYLRRQRERRIAESRAAFFADLRRFATDARREMPDLFVGWERARRK
jgi:hypothetical protein